MKDLINLKTLKMIGGGAIILAAFFIMMPGLLTYLAGLSRIIIFVSVVLIGAAVLSRVYATISARSRKSAAPSSPAQTEPETPEQNRQTIEE